jgi:hypothetical protein
MALDKSDAEGIAIVRSEAKSPRRSDAMGELVKMASGASLFRLRSKDDRAVLKSAAVWGYSGAAGW